MSDEHGDIEQRERIINLRREDWLSQNGDHVGVECPSDDELWDEYIEEKEGSGFEGDDYIKSMGLDENVDNDDYGGVLNDE